MTTAPELDFSHVLEFPAESRWIELMRQRQERDLDELPAKGFYFDEDAGERVITFVEQCRHHKGEWAGKRIQLQEWQRELVRILFGWLREDGTRRFRRAYLEIARKNGKSTLAAALGLYLLLADREPGAEIYSAATKKDQAKIVHGDAEKMVKASPFLRRYLNTFKNNISCPRLGSKFEPLGSDSETLDGLNPHAAILDELHAHRDRGVFDILDTAFGSRRQPLMLMITTAGMYNPESIGFEQHKLACDVLEGTIEDDELFAFVAAAEEKDDPFEPATWRKANPGLGTTPKLEYLASQARKARNSPRFLNTFKRLHLNMWTQQLDSWLDMEDWNACRWIPSTSARLNGAPCFGGLDLADTRDLAAFVWICPDADMTHPAAKIDVYARFYCPQAAVEARSREAKVSYASWIADNWITATPGNVIDHDFILEDIKEIGREFNIREIAFDRWGASRISIALDQAGFSVAATGQGFASLSAPSKALETFVARRQLAHGGNPVLRWNANNAAVEEDAAGNIKPSKRRSADKIDGIVALVMALDRFTRYTNTAIVVDGELTVLG